MDTEAVPDEASADRAKRDEETMSTQEPGASSANWPPQPPQQLPLAAGEVRAKRVERLSCTVPVPMDVCTSAEPHIFIWAADVQESLEAFTCSTSTPAIDLRAVAAENYRLVRDGGYINPETGQLHRLQTRGLPNRTHKLRRGERRLRLRFRATRVSVANIDTASALWVLRSQGFSSDQVVALNFANAYVPGGGYLHGARAQEEDLCRLMPPLYSSLKRLRYPIAADSAHYTHTWLCRRSGSYRLTSPTKVAIISAAMPNLKEERRLVDQHDSWERTVETRIHSVLSAAREEGHTCLVLGAFGCGAFRNPPDEVARMFARALRSDEFKGEFEEVLFAIVDPKSTDHGNLASFRRVMINLCAEKHQPPKSD